MRRRSPFTRSVRSLLLIVASVALLPIVFVQAAGASAATLTKELDGIQGQGFTSPSTFKTGANVRYRLTFQCSSLTTPCVTGTITDVLDPNLEYVQMIPPSSSDVSATPTWDAPSHTLTIAIGSFDDGDSGEVVVVARVKGTTPGGTTIPNHASITVPNGPTVTTTDVDIDVPPSSPNWAIAKRVQTPANAAPAPGTDVTYAVEIQAPTRLGNVAITDGTVTDTYPAGATVVDAGGGTVDTANHTITWPVGAIDPASIYCTNDPLACYQGVANITLNFPSSNFSANQTATNSVLGHYNYSNGMSGDVSASASVTFATPNPDRKSVV